jgi:hypothetical protein
MQVVKDRLGTCCRRLPERGPKFNQMRFCAERQSDYWQYIPSLRPTLSN